MWKALVHKELTELKVFAILALAAYAYCALGIMGMPLFPGSSSGQRDIPFIGPSFYSWYIVVAATFAIALGLRQTLGESLGGTFQFLLTRPAGRSAIYVKLVVGLSVYLMVSAIPIVLVAIWAAAPRTHASPFYWWMTGQAWCIWLSISFVYFGAFLCGLRRAHWLGTRLAPLLAASIAAFFLANTEAPAFLQCLGVIVGAALILSIPYVVKTRDFA